MDDRHTEALAEVYQKGIVNKRKENTLSYSLEEVNESEINKKKENVSFPRTKSEKSQTKFLNCDNDWPITGFFKN